MLLPQEVFAHGRSPVPDRHRVPRARAQPQRGRGSTPASAGCLPFRYAGSEGAPCPATEPARQHGLLWCVERSAVRTQWFLRPELGVEVDLCAAHEPPRLLGAGGAKIWRSADPAIGLRILTLLIRE